MNLGILNTITPILIVIVLVAAIWAVVELAVTLRKARKTVETANQMVEKADEFATQAKEQLEPALARIDPILESVQPAAARLDPMVEHAQLTVDAANLEIMRLDQILEDVSHVTAVAGKAADSVDKVTSGPAELVTGAVEKIRGTAKDSARQRAAKRALTGESGAALPGAQGAALEQPEAPAEEPVPEPPAADNEASEKPRRNRRAATKRVTIEAGCVPAEKAPEE